MKNKIGFGVVLLVVVFLAGFLPSFVKAHRLENELRKARNEFALAQLRDLASLAYFQASQKNYGLASGTSTRFFDGAREAANQTADASAKKPLEDWLSFRDSITAGLARGDPTVLHDLETLFLKTREGTASASVVQRHE